MGGAARRAAPPENVPAFTRLAGDRCQPPARLCLPGRPRLRDDSVAEADTQQPMEPDCFTRVAILSGVAEVLDGVAIRLAAHPDPHDADLRNVLAEYGVDLPLRRHQRLSMMRIDVFDKDAHVLRKACWRGLSPTWGLPTKPTTPPLGRSKLMLSSPLRSPKSLVNPLV